MSEPIVTAVAYWAGVALLMVAFVAAIAVLVYAVGVLSREMLKDWKTLWRLRHRGFLGYMDRMVREWNRGSRPAMDTLAHLRQALVVARQGIGMTADEVEQGFPCPVCGSIDSGPAV